MTVVPMVADSVSKTLFIPQWAKAEEMKQPHGILKDLAAARVVSMLPQALFVFPKKKPMMVGSVVRARYFDEIAEAALAASTKAVLVHLGCGLDDRFGRTDAGSGIQVNLDLPEVVELRRKLMPSQNSRNIDWPGSLLEVDWMERILEMWPGATFTFFMEGLLMYFAEDDVRRLFVNLADRFPGSSLHFDACNTYMCRQVGNQKAIRKTNAAFKWGMDDDVIIEKWHGALRHTGTTYYFDIHRQRWGWLSLLRFVPRFNRGSRMLSYRIVES